MAEGTSSTSTRARVVGGILRTIDISTAILLLTGQISATGVFVYPRALFISATGPIFNGQRLIGEGDIENSILNGIDMIVALLLILGQLRVYGPFPGPHILSLTITGPPLGVTAVPVPNGTSAKAETFFRDFREYLLQTYRYRER